MKERRQQDYAKAAATAAIGASTLTRRQRRAAMKKSKLRGKGWTKA